MFVFLSGESLKERKQGGEGKVFPSKKKKQRIKSLYMRHWVSVMRELFILRSSQES